MGTGQFRACTPGRGAKTSSPARPRKAMALLPLPKHQGASLLEPGAPHFLPKAWCLLAQGSARHQSPPAWGAGPVRIWVALHPPRASQAFDLKVEDVVAPLVGVLPALTCRGRCAPWSPGWGDSHQSGGASLSRPRRNILVDVIRLHPGGRPRYRPHLPACLRQITGRRGRRAGCMDPASGQTRLRPRVQLRSCLSALSSSIVSVLGTRTPPRCGEQSARSGKPRRPPSHCSLEDVFPLVF